MRILQQLQAAGKFQKSPEGVALKTALYNVRMLRAGYLYVHIDRGEIGMCAADEWKGYAIHPYGYLFDFDVMSPASAEIKVACAREGRQANASMVWMQNPLQVKKLWYLFHPDPINPEHLFKEIAPNISKYMQSFDVAAWASGTVFQPDTCQPGQLSGQIMEFAAMNNPSVQKVSVEQHYGLMGESGRERGWGEYREARYGKHFEPVRHEKHGIDGSISVTDDRASGGVAEGSYVAEVHAPAYEEVHGQRLKQIADLLQTKKGAVLACRDPLGIAQELSLHKLTAAIPYSTWLASTANAQGEIDKNNAKVTNLWRETAAACLNTMVRAIHERVMKVYDEKTEKLEVQRKRLEKQDTRYLPKETLKVQPDGGYEYESVEKNRQARKEELDEEIAQRHFEREEVSMAEAAKALEKTQAHYSVEALKNFTDEHAQEQIKRNTKMDAIAEDAIAWLQQISVKSNALELYSRRQEGLKTGDGVNCAAQLCAALTPMSSSPKGRAWLASLKIFGDDPKDLVWRMISFNNEEIVRELLQAMSVLNNTLPATSAEDKVASVEESARQQRAFADMITALDKIPKTLAQSNSIIEASKDALGKNTPILRRINALQKIVNTARKNIYSVFSTVVTISAKNIPASLREKRLASAQLICMAHGLGQKIRPALEKMRMMELEEKKQQERGFITTLKKIQNREVVRGLGC